MSLETCKLCNKDCTPWVHINGHICQDCALPISKWISVKDGLPPYEEEVLAFYRGSIILAIRSNFDGGNYWSSETAYDIPVTHWMPLPPKPEQG